MANSSRCLFSFPGLYYAAQLGINAKPKEKASTTLLMSLLDQLEDVSASAQSYASMPALTLIRPALRSSR